MFRMYFAIKFLQVYSFNIEKKKLKFGCLLLDVVLVIYNFFLWIIAENFSNYDKFTTDFLYLNEFLYNQTFTSQNFYLIEFLFINIFIC